MDFKRHFTAQIIHFLSPEKVLFVLLAALICFNVYNHAHVKTKPKTYAHQTLALPQLPPKKIIQEKPLAAPVAPATSWISITTQPRDTLGKVFSRQGISQKTLQTLLNDIEHKKILTNIKPNQTIQLLMHDQTLEKIKMPLGGTQFLMVSLENNHYVSKLNIPSTEQHNQYLTATLRGSLFGTARQLNIPYKLIQQMVNIFNWEIDFSREVRSGDQFSILYAGRYVNDKLVGVGDILAVSYTNRGKRYEAILHKNAYGQLDYFTPQGTSLRKAFSRYPVHFSRISSTFNLARMHPILHYKRPHKGIDLAAPRGTPIRATGDGRVILIGRQHGYGNVIKIAHQSRYTSIYGHLLKFQQGLKRGSFVRRDQVIGYVGQSGLASGPHCHYEFHINNQPQNPTTVPLPHATPLTGKNLLAFKAHANQLLASLKLYESSHFARGQQKSRVG